MKKIWQKRKNWILIILGALVLITSFILGFHNATLYNPSHGFDGIDHLNYIRYIKKNWQLPPISLLKEYHQSPLYYVIGALLMSITGTWKTAQYINIFVLWLIIGMVGLGMWKVFKNLNNVLIGMFSLASLPMLNIFPAMITNELFGTFWIISGLTALIFLIYAKERKTIILHSLWLILSFIIGYWTKVSIILILSVIFCAYIILFIRNSQLRKFIFVIFFVAMTLMAVFSSPIYFRAKKQYSASDITLTLQQKPVLRSDLSFYYRLDWIPKVDMYNTQYYSMLGGAWNSFWTDGHNAITPFVKFHKKSLILWLLGFILLPLSIYGLISLYRKKKAVAILTIITGLTMLGTYVYLNIYNHYSAARLTYEMGIILPYSFGLAAASQNKKIKYLLFILLSIQFAVMVSFYWIQPWWHVTK